MNQDSRPDETGPIELDERQSQTPSEPSQSPQGPEALVEDLPPASVSFPGEKPSEKVPPADVIPFEAGGPTPDLEILDAVRRLDRAIHDRFEQVENLLRRETRAEASREKVIDRLHAELQEYKQDLLLGTLRPVFIDLIQLHDDVGKMAVVAPESVEEGRAEESRLVGLMKGYQQGIEDILYRQGVEPFVVEGDVFDPRRQRAIATVANDDPARNRTVAARHRKGFQAGERVIRPEIVSVFAVKKGT